MDSEKINLKTKKNITFRKYQENFKLRKIVSLNKCSKSEISFPFVVIERL